MSDFVSVGKVDEFPSGYVRGFKVSGREVAVVSLDGVFYAFSNECTHENVDLAETDLDGNRLTCTFHGSVFDVTTGKALEGPAYKPLEQYGVRIDGDMVLIQVDNAN